MKIEFDDLSLIIRTGLAALRSPKTAHRLLQQVPARIRASVLLDNLFQKGAAVVHREPGGLEQFFDNKQGRGIQKWRHYFDIYERHFGKFVGKEVHVVEVGVASGGSLEMWRNYFGEKCYVYGIDINPACKKFETNGVKIFIGDQGDRNFWQRFKAEIPFVDILIDDGSHIPEHQIVTLEEMLPHVSPNGVYLCEDIEKQHPPHPLLSYLAPVVEELHLLTFAPGDDSSYLTGLPNGLQSSISSIHFYPFVVVVEKRRSAILRSDKRGAEWL